MTKLSEFAARWKDSIVDSPYFARNSIAMAALATMVAATPFLPQPAYSSPDLPAYTSSAEHEMTIPEAKAMDIERAADLAMAELMQTTFYSVHVPKNQDVIVNEFRSIDFTEIDAMNDALKGQLSDLVTTAKDKSIDASEAHERWQALKDATAHLKEMSAALKGGDTPTAIEAYRDLETKLDDYAYKYSAEFDSRTAEEFSKAARFAFKGDLEHRTATIAEAMAEYEADQAPRL